MNSFNNLQSLINECLENETATILELTRMKKYIDKIIVESLEHDILETYNIGCKVKTLDSKLMKVNKKDLAHHLDISVATLYKKIENKSFTSQEQQEIQLFIRRSNE